jgi:hypothetical protein
MKSKAKKPRSLPKDSERCEAKTAKGTQCRCKALPGKKLCTFHSKEGIEGRAKGRARLHEDAEAINASLARLDIRSPENQKKHIAHIIWTAIDNREKLSDIAKFYALLIQLTKESDPTQTLIIERVIRPPE